MPDPAVAEGSRSLYPAGIAGERADLDLSSPTPLYAGVAARRQFLYVYAKQGEYILLGSSNRNTNDNADIAVFNPQSFGAKGNETLPAAADFNCRSTTPGAGNFSGVGRGYIAARPNELAGPNSADGTQTVADGYLPCAYRAPIDGIYGVQFAPARSGGTGASGVVGPAGNFPLASGGVAAWDVTVRSAADSLADIDARVFTYVWAGRARGSDRIHHTLYYGTLDGARYRQTLRGIVPVGYGLWANSAGFLDNGQPLYRDLRGTGGSVDSWVAQAELSAQPPQTPIFFSDIDPAGPNAAATDDVLRALDIPLAPKMPVVENARFNGLQGGNQTYVGGGGTFTFTAQHNTSYEIVISADGVDFDPAAGANARLTGLAPDGLNTVIWSGRANDGTVFPAGTFSFRVVGRNGEIHFPMVDIEGNASGGPSVVKLNGLQSGDATVYYDDRGYVTRNGIPVGSANDALCGTNPTSGTPAPPAPAYSLQGVDSAAASNGLYYRHWSSRGNPNTDCGANAGFGDAKALDLWTYQQTPVQTAVLVVIQPPTTTVLATQVSVPASADPGAVVYGSLDFQNVGTVTASEVTYGTLAGQQSVAIGVPGNCPTGLVFDLLPSGVTFDSYDLATCVARFSNLPTSLAGRSSQRLVFNFHYVAPASGRIPVSTDTNASNSTNHPNASGVTYVNGATADLAIDKTDGSATYLPGDAITYTVTVMNTGPGDANSVDIVDAVPPSIRGVSATCAATGTAACGADASNGNAVAFRGSSIAAGAGNALTLTIAGTVATDASGDLVNTASVSPGTGANFSDPEDSNDSSTDTDTAAAEADLAIVKTGPGHVNPGQGITYALLITNDGPSAADGATYGDAVPSPQITGVSATCGSATGGAVCANPAVDGNSVSGTIPTLPSGGSVTITISGTVAADSSAMLVNVGVVNAPAGVIERNTANNSSTSSTTTPVSLLRFEVD